jgi:hypothetical protein
MVERHSNAFLEDLSKWHNRDVVEYALPSEWDVIKGDVLLARLKSGRWDAGSNYGFAEYRPELVGITEPEWTAALHGDPTEVDWILRNVHSGVTSQFRQFLMTWQPPTLYVKYLGPRRGSGAA